MTHHCDLAQDHIVFYALDDLGGARREYVEAHIAGCPDCQRRLAEFRKVKQLLQESSVARDDPSHRAAIVDGIVSEDRSQRRTRAKHGRFAHKRTLRHWQPMLLAGLLLALAVAFLAPEASRASFPLGRVIGILDESTRTVSSVIPIGQELSETPEPQRYDVAEPPFQPVTSAALPLGLQLLDQTWSPSHDAISQYDNANGLTIELIQTPVAESDLSISPNIKTITIRDTVVVQHTSPEPGAIAALYWVRDGFIFQLSPVRAPYGGLIADDVYLIVRALMQAQDAMP